MKKSIGNGQTAFPLPVLVVGTYDGEGKANASTFGWAGNVGSNPRAIAIVVRRSHYTHDNLLLKRAFTVNIPSIKYVAEADYFGIASGRNEDKIAKAGLHAEKAQYVDAPIISEFPVNIECEVSQVLDRVTHTLFIGEVKDIKVEDTALGEDGKLNIIAAGLLSYDPSTNTYFTSEGVLAKAFSVGKSLQ
jgi:flavin reductase (DIM6/NTAB) family NADH-FMN oxidoreductase RutF